MARNVCVTYMRRMRVTNVARTCHARSAQQGMLLLDPSVINVTLTFVKFKRNKAAVVNILTLFGDIMANGEGASFIASD
jgi:hypothetical protein